MAHDISSDFTIDANTSNKSQYNLEWFKNAVDFDGSND